MRKATGNPNGRPPYSPTEADRATVKHLAAAGTPHEQICICLGIDGIDLVTMYKHFRRELDTSKGQVTAFAMSAVIKGIQAGELDAARLWLRCRAGWKETNDLQVSGPDGGKIPVVISQTEAKF